jgi:hypothetical protein
VDAINWLLSKAGVPVSQSPVGGSQWMEQKGLTRKVPQGAASVLGETAGLLAPFAVAAKAPQIAGGLNQMVANAQTPATINAQRGAIVWHGSPHKFDRFDSSKIGTGEGAQAYGHGLYLAEKQGVADSYRRTLTAGVPDVYVNGRRLSGGALNTAANQLAETKDVITRDDLRRHLTDRLADAIDSTSPYAAAHAKELREALKKLQGAKEVRVDFDGAGGALYKVDLPDEQIAKMLDWDKPLSQQAPEVQDIFSGLSRLGVDDPMSLTGGTAYRRMHEAAIRQGKPEPAAIKEMQMVRGLRSAGLPGIRYLDGGSRGAGAGTSNYVVFPGGEDYLTILERNGISVR